MSNDEPLEVQIPTAPQANVDDGIVRSAKQFSDILTLEMTDEEIKNAFEIAMTVINKYHYRWLTMHFTSEYKVRKELDAFEDEIKTRLAEIGVLATVDPTPIFDGQPPIVDFIGRIPGTTFDKYGQDHEKKEWEVKKATERGEDYLGQKR